MPIPIKSGLNRVYLAGPMTGLPDFNYPAFNRAAKRLRDKGFSVENPAENQAPECKSWAGYMRLAIRQMLTCDLAIFLPGWNESKGASLEFYVASQLKMPVFNFDDAINDLVLDNAEVSHG